MSRATISTASSAVTTTNNKIYLAAQNGSRHGKPLIVSRIPFAASVPSVEMTLAEYATFRWFMLHLYRINTGMSGLNCWEIIPLYDGGALRVMLHFLYADIAKLVAPKLQSHPYMQLDRTALALYRPTNFFQILASRTESWGNVLSIPYNYCFHMSIRHKIRFLIQPVLTAAFNADLDGLKKHLESISSNARKSLLSEKGTITIEHLKERYPGITRTGTLLQMAIFDDDEEMVGYLKTKMIDDEFHHQCREVFENAINSTTDEIKITLKDHIASLQKNNVTTEDYFRVMREVQKREAETLCAVLRKRFIDVDERDFPHGTSTPSLPLRDQVNDFIKQKVLNYVKTHPINNPYLLQTVYDIYANLPAINDYYRQYRYFLQKIIGNSIRCNYDRQFRYFLQKFIGDKRDHYFLQKIIGSIQSFLSPRWLNHFTQNIEDLGNNKIVPLRSFICRDGSDIRTLVSSCIGDNLFLSMLGQPACEAAMLASWRDWLTLSVSDYTNPKPMPRKNSGLSELTHITKLISRKNSGLSELIAQPALACARKSEHRCSIM